MYRRFYVYCHLSVVSKKNFVTLMYANYHYYYFMIFLKCVIANCHSFHIVNNLICLYSAIRSKKKEKKRRIIEAEMNTDELMDTPIFKKFLSAIDKILDSADMAELPALNAGLCSFKMLNVF